MKVKKVKLERQKLFILIASVIFIFSLIVMTEASDKNYQRSHPMTQCHGQINCEGWTMFFSHPLIEEATVRLYENDTLVGFGTAPSTNESTSEFSGSWLIQPNNSAIIKIEVEYFGGHILFYSMPNSCNSCIENIVNSSWSNWVNQTQCVNNLLNQSRTSTEYDANSCGGFNNVTHREYRSIQCGISCTENIVNTTWSEWINNTGCINGTLEQTRTSIEYDANSCGSLENTTHKENRQISCTMPGQCEEDRYGENYCSGDDVYHNFYNYSNNFPTCTLDVTPVLAEECSNYCSNGECREDDNDEDDNNGGGNDNSWNPTKLMEPVNYFLSYSDKNQGLNNSENLVFDSSKNLKDNDSKFDGLELVIIILAILIIILII